MEEFLELLACPVCRGALAADWSCNSCGKQYEAPDGIPNLRLRSDIVLRFYADVPFPGYPARDSLTWLRARSERSKFARLLDQAIPGDASILDLGCGTGRMSLYLARADRLVIGADLTRASLKLAASGVLHHTPDPRTSFARIAQLARPSGMIVLGLYNVFARIPPRFRRFVARLTRYRLIPFDPVLRDRKDEQARRLAWLRDNRIMTAAKTSGLNHRHPRLHTNLSSLSPSPIGN